MNLCTHAGLEPRAMHLYVTSSPRGSRSLVSSCDRSRSVRRVQTVVRQVSFPCADSSFHLCIIARLATLIDIFRSHSDRGKSVPTAQSNFHGSEELLALDALCRLLLQAPLGVGWLGWRSSSRSTAGEGRGCCRRGRRAHGICEVVQGCSGDQEAHPAPSLVGIVGRPPSRLQRPEGWRTAFASWRRYWQW